MSTMKKADYGVDAPGLVRGFLGGGGLMVLVTAAVDLWMPSIALPRALPSIGVSFFATGLLMLASSRFGKLRARDRLFAQLGLRTDARVLDVGCGRGLLLIGAAHRVPSGDAVGVDLWSQRDLADNRREATLENARREGVAERVTVVDGDMRALPFDTGRFDAVVSCFAIHNVPDREGRRSAIREIARVLTAGGRVSIQDFSRTAEYAEDLRAAGLDAVERSGLSFWTFPPSRVVTATKS